MHYTHHVGEEIDLLANYPRTDRDVATRGAAKTEADRRVARRFAFEFFDGDRRHGYGGYRYHPRFWRPVVPAFVARYGLEAGHRVLDVGCAKGFLLHDLAAAIPGLEVWGVDVSPYAIDQAVPAIRPRLAVGDAKSLPFRDGHFDLVISLTTLHNLERDDCSHGLAEVQRVSLGPCFVTLDAYRNEIERARMNAWNLTARTVMSTNEWRDFFLAAGYRGDYAWFSP